MSIFKDPVGQWSSKRVVGIGYALLGVVMVLTWLFTDKESDMDILLVVVGTAMTALGISEISKTSALKGVTPPPGTPPKEDDPEN